MKIAVVGPGAMGCLFAGTLVEAGHDVCVLDHDRVRARELSASGIKIESQSGVRKIRINAVHDPSGFVGCEMVIICVKAFDTCSAAELAKPLTGENATVLSLQNGWGNAERILGVSGYARVVCGATAQGAVLLAPGHVRHAGDGPTRIAAWDERWVSSAVSAARVLTGAGIRATVAENCRSMIWEKLIVNAAINPLTALSRVRNGVLLKDVALNEAMGRVIAESTLVAQDDKMTFTVEEMLDHVQAVCEATENNESSMLQDLKMGRRTEVDFITGVIVKRALAAGIPVPASEILLACVKGAEKSKST